MLDLISHMPSSESGSILFILYRYKGLFNDIHFSLWIKRLPRHNHKRLSLNQDIEQHVYSAFFVLAKFPHAIQPNIR